MNKKLKALSDNQINSQLAHVLTHTDFKWLGELYEGKVRDCYDRGETKVLITTDRLSCFDVVVTTVPFKGQVLTQLAAHWFKQAESIIPTHLLDLPDPNVMVVQNCEIVPVEVIVRGYLAGSAWRDYVKGNPVSGVMLPTGLKEFQKLPSAIITPSTKAARGLHDQPISEKELLAGKLVPEKTWSAIKAAALALFDLGSRVAASRGLILVDTKYEFGLAADKLLLADEVHTLDSSRYWEADSYTERVQQGLQPVMLDKEPVRQWLLSQGFGGDGPLPVITDQYRAEISRHYIGAFERISGEAFEAKVGSAYERIERQLRSLYG